MAARNRHRRSARRASRANRSRLSGRRISSRRNRGIGVVSYTPPRPEAWSYLPGRVGNRRHVPLTFGMLPARVSTRINPRSLNYAQTFKVPHSVVICARRKARREVLFAQGKGGGRHRRPRRTTSSSVSCS